MPRTGRQKTFIADADIRELLEKSTEVLRKASGGTYREADLFRALVRQFAAVYALKEGPRLLKERLRKTTNEADARRVEAEYERRVEELREAVARWRDEKK